MLITLLSKAFGTESASEEHSAGVLLCAPSWTAGFTFCSEVRFSSEALCKTFDLFSKVWLRCKKSAKRFKNAKLCIKGPKSRL